MQNAVKEKIKDSLAWSMLVAVSLKLCRAFRTETKQHCFQFEKLYHFNCHTRFTWWFCIINRNNKAIQSQRQRTKDVKFTLCLVKCFEMGCHLVRSMLTQLSLDKLMDYIDSYDLALQGDYRPQPLLTYMDTASCLVFGLNAHTLVKEVTKHVPQRWHPSLTRHDFTFFILYSLLKQWN